MALVLGREPGEKVIIIDDHNKEIEVEVIKTGGSLRLKITAPPEFQIVRGEIYEGNNS